MKRNLEPIKLSSLDELLCIIDKFKTSVEELYKRDKLIFTQIHFKEITDRVNKICENFNENYREANYQNTFEINNYNEEDKMDSIEPLIQESIAADIVENNKICGTDKIAKKSRRRVSLKYIEHWEKILDEQNSTLSKPIQTQRIKLNAADRCFVKKRIQQFDEQERRKSSAIDSYSEFSSAHLDRTNKLKKSYSADVLSEIDESNESYFKNVTNNATDDASSSDKIDTNILIQNQRIHVNNKPRIVGMLLKKPGWE